MLKVIFVRLYSALWLKLGPQGLMEKAKKKLKNCKDEQKEFYECTILVLEGGQFNLWVDIYVFKLKAN